MSQDFANLLFSLSNDVLRAKIIIFWSPVTIVSLTMVSQRFKKLVEYCYKSLPPPGRARTECLLRSLFLDNNEQQMQWWAGIFHYKVFDITGRYDSNILILLCEVTGSLIDFTPVLF